MSMAFVPSQQKKGQQGPVNIQKMLDENQQLIATISDYQSKGKANECLQYQQILHRNLVYLATIADANTSHSHSLLPSLGAGGPPQGPGGMQQPPNAPPMGPMRPPGGMGGQMPSGQFHPRMGMYNQYPRPPM